MKVAHKTSPEKLIKERARKLPIKSCMINSNWEDSDIANIFVAREHINGNITFGTYLVDLLCVGLKDTWYGFNVDVDEYTRMLNHDRGVEFIEVPYKLVHNIIYGGIDFAEQYSIEPHKDFNVSEFVLENDDDDKIKFIDIHFGDEDDKAIFIYNPYVDTNDKYIKILKENNQEEDYSIVYADMDIMSDDDDFVIDI